MRNLQLIGAILIASRFVGPAVAQVPGASRPTTAALDAAALRQQIEADWLRQAGQREGEANAPVYPTRAVMASARAAADERRPRVASGDLARLKEIEARLAALPADGRGPEHRRLYLAARWAARRIVLSDPLLRIPRLLLVTRFTQETYPDVCLNHMPWVSRPGGDIGILELGADGLGALADPPADARAAAGFVALINGALGPGHVHGIDLAFDGRRVVFGYARSRSARPPEGWLNRSRSYELRRSEEPIHLFEIGIDGRGLRQLTDGPWSDLDPTYVPDGRIVFVSERCGTSLQCNEYDKDETSCNLYSIRADGSDLRRLSVNKDGDYLPHCLDNGLVAYTRWEYHERSWAYIQSIWIVRPDGTGADALFKQHFVNPWALEDTRSIPGDNRLVAIAAGHHTLPAGPVVIVDHNRGINEPAGIGIVTPGVRPPEGGMDGRVVPQGGVRDSGGFYSHPWALSPRTFLVSYAYGASNDPRGYGLYLIDVFGNKELLYRDPDISAFHPMPLRPRPTPPVLPDTTDPALDFAVCTLSEAAFGCEGLKPGDARYVRVAEPIGWPYDLERGGHRYGEDHRYGGPGAERKNLTNWTPIRILGDVPLEADGSARFRVPADRAVYFQLLDGEHRELRRMRSFISFQPGEQRSCTGCHESRAIASTTARLPLATLNEALTPTPPPWGDRPISFLRDVQPILDRHCTECHSGLKPAGGIDLDAGLVSYDAAVPGYGHNRAFETILEKGLVALSAARAQDASVTPPLAYGSRKSRLLTALGSSAHGSVRLSADERWRLAAWIDANAPYHDRFVDKRPTQPAYDLAADEPLRQVLLAVHRRRCGPCHQAEAISRLDWVDLRRPEGSRFLAAAVEHRRGCGGYAGADDPDYRQLLSLVRAAVERQWQRPRRDIRSLTATSP